MAAAAGALLLLAVASPAYANDHDVYEASLGSAPAQLHPSTTR